MTAVEQTRRVPNLGKRLDSIFGSLIGATVVAIIVTSTIHLIKSEPIGLERILIGGISGGIGGIIGLFIITEIAGHKWITTVLLSLAVGILDGLLVGAAVTFFPSMF
ncbi:MAG: hypothetical protein WAO19_10015 [Candidatus Kryptoniota bacterium]